MPEWGCQDAIGCPFPHAEKNPGDEPVPERVSFILYPTELGHENISTTSGFYAFVTLDTLAKAMERTNPEKENTGNNWKEEKIAEALYRL